MDFSQLTLLHLVNLSQAFHDDDFVAPNLLYYLAKPKFDPGNFDFDKYYESLENRVPFDQLGARGYDNLRYAPQDRGVLMTRSNTLANDNRAYSLATKNDLTASEAVEFGEIKPGWSLNFALKDFLMSHLEIAKDYFGFVPFGGPVVAFLQALASPPEINFRNPTYKDHVTLREMTNSIARQYNIPPIMVNNWMYIEGKKILAAEEEQL